MALILKPQPGKQTDFLKSPADIVVYGGAAGGGKSYGLLLVPVKYIHIPYAMSVLFRKEAVQVRQPGGVFDVGRDMYVPIGAKINKMDMTFTWESEAKIKMAHMTNDDMLLDWLGSATPIQLWDELTHFSKKQFFFMFSRNRNFYKNGIKPMVRATCNPDVNSWLREFLDWWINPETGIAIESRCGVIRWFVNHEDVIYWYDTEEAAILKWKRFKIPPKSVTFINSNLNDNKILTEMDPSYEANLMAMPNIDRERYLNGNWNISPSSGDYFSRETFPIVEATPQLKTIVRAWDFGASDVTDVNPDPDYSVGVKVGVDASGVFYVLDMVRFRKNPAEFERRFLNVRSQDGLETHIKIPQDPAAAGKSYSDIVIRMCAGSIIKASSVSGDKVTRARVASSQSEAGNVKVLKAWWNAPFFSELESFPIDKNGIGHDDIVDAFADAITYLTEKGAKASIVNRDNLPNMLREF